jgi:hypothetical protein
MQSTEAVQVSGIATVVPQAASRTVWAQSDNGAAYTPFAQRASSAPCSAAASPSHDESLSPLHVRARWQRAEVNTLSALDCE